MTQPTKQKIAITIGALLAIAIGAGLALMAIGCASFHRLVG
jgi:hypothetical protein